MGVVAGRGVERRGRDGLDLPDPELLGAGPEPPPGAVGVAAVELDSDAAFGGVGVAHPIGAWYPLGR